MGVNYSSTIERMRWAGKLKNDSAVARVLGITPQAISNYKKRGEMPSNLILKFSNIYGLSMDWLLTGEGAMLKNTTRSAEFQSCNIAELTPDEIIYIGKLLKILRETDKKIIPILIVILDSFLKTSGMSLNQL